MDTTDTISAICTGLGGAISIIRVSGYEALNIVNKFWKGKSLLDGKNTRKMILGNILHNNSLGEPVLAVYMKNPYSYTGEDVVEIHCHGGAFSSKKILEITIKNGARLAEPGEFSYRAFINGKMDLTQAEAVSDLIYAHSNTALHVAERQISGSLTNKFKFLKDELVALLAECESRLDFPEEELDWKSKDSLISIINEQILTIEKINLSQKEGEILRNGICVVIAGRPNAGKSSLMNFLLRRERAIVTDLPGTTRDTLEEFVSLRNIPVRLIDTAGIRDANDIIEKIGIEKSHQSVKNAQILFWILDASVDDIVEEYEYMKNYINDNKSVIAIWNKMDLKTAQIAKDNDISTICISLKNETGIEELLDTFEELVWEHPHSEEPEIAVNERHSSLLNEAMEVLPLAIIDIDDENWELVATHLRSAIYAIGKIVGDISDPDILEDIFNKFCIGK